MSKRITKFGAVANICGGLKANYSNVAPKIMYYSARGPDPGDTLPHEAEILKPNLVAPGNLIWAAWSSRGTDSVEFLGNVIITYKFQSEHKHWKVIIVCFSLYYIISITSP